MYVRYNGCGAYCGLLAGKKMARRISNRGFITGFFGNAKGVMWGTYNIHTCIFDSPARFRWGSGGVLVFGVRILADLMYL